MDKTQPFFDPYNFNIQAGHMAQMQQPNIDTMTQFDPTLQNPNMGPAMYYEQQYMYYKYLTQMLEYKIKLKEFEKLTKEK